MSRPWWTSHPTHPGAVVNAVKGKFKIGDEILDRTRAGEKKRCTRRLGRLGTRPLGCLSRRLTILATSLDPKGGFGQLPRPNINVASDATANFDEMISLSSSKLWVPLLFKYLSVCFYNGPFFPS